MYLSILKSFKSCVGWYFIDSIMEIHPGQYIYHVSSPNMTFFNSAKYSFAPISQVKVFHWFLELKVLIDYTLLNYSLLYGTCLGISSYGVPVNKKTIFEKFS